VYRGMKTEKSKKQLKQDLRYAWIYAIFGVIFLTFGYTLHTVFTILGGLMVGYNICKLQFIYQRRKNNG